MEGVASDGRSETGVLSTLAPEHSSPEASRDGDEASVKAEETSPLSSMSSCCSPVSRTVRHQRTSSLHRWKRQMQRAWKWGANGNTEQCYKTTFNLEVLANQKRQWYRMHSRSRDCKQREPTSLFEHFYIVGLHSYANVEAIEDAYARRKTWESEVEKSEIFDLPNLHYHGHPPLLEPEILFKYPPGKKLAMREKDLPAFCFPGGVKAQVIQRTPSMSDLNEVIFGQEHLAQDDLSFIFCLKDSDNATLYGVCLHVREIVQRAPGIFGVISPPAQALGKLSTSLVSAPRCYCILTRVPFFELHYEMLNSIIAQERLDRITQFVSEMVLTDNIPNGVRELDQMDENSDSPVSSSFSNWTDSATPVTSNNGRTSASAGPVSDLESRSFSFRSSGAESPESTTTSEVSDFGHAKYQEKDMRKGLQYIDDFASEGSESCSDSLERANIFHENGQISPMSNYSNANKLERIESLESIYSSVRSTVSDGEDDDLNRRYERSAGDEKVMEWAKANNNEPLQIVCGYHSLPMPARGSEVIFHPLEHLQPIRYRRPAISDLGLGFTYSNVELSYPSDVEAVNARLAAAEEAVALSVWSTATICRVLSLESVLTLFAGVLLEKQVVVVCPNLGVLSATVLSLIPMIQPFEWQSLLLPVLPRKMLDFLDAPVPFIVGIQQKSADFKMKTTNLIRVNVLKDQVKSCSMPMLPRYRELFSELSPIHARLACENSIAKRHSVHKCNEVQVEAAIQFLNAIRRYTESLCSNLRSHTITSVQSNNDRVSLLLKESFIDSFSLKDRPFIKLFLDTQLFSVQSDSRLSSYENEQY